MDLGWVKTLWLTPEIASPCVAAWPVRSANFGPIGAASMLSSTMLAICRSVRRKPSRQSNSPKIYDINVLSTQRVNRAALPEVRKQGRGLVV